MFDFIPFFSSSFEISLPEGKENVLSTSWKADRIIAEVLVCGIRALACHLIATSRLNHVHSLLKVGLCIAGARTSTDIESVSVRP
jgi:hypothetical protein